MAKPSITVYRARDFSHLGGLQGLSDQQIEIHLGLYQGYVTNTNALNEQRVALLGEGKSGSPLFAELTRRLGFEYNGMILHEHYFENLTPNGSGRPAAGSPLQNSLEATFGSYEQWFADFEAVAKMRGVGWAILFQDPSTGFLTNQWITLHQDGNPAGFKPLLVLDVWEHAFMVDYKPSERAKYIEAFFSNIDWRAVEARLSQPSSASNRAALANS